MDQADDNSLTALLTKREQVRFCEIVNTCTERREEKRIQRTAWILSHVLRKTLCEHVNGLCPAGKLNEQSITKHWFQSVRTCPYSCATGRNSGSSNPPKNGNRGGIEQNLAERFKYEKLACWVWKILLLNIPTHKVPLQHIKHPCNTQSTPATTTISETYVQRPVSQ